MPVAHLLGIGPLGVHREPRLPGGLGRGAQLRHLLPQRGVLGATGGHPAACLLYSLFRSASLGDGSGMSLHQLAPHVLACVTREQRTAGLLGVLLVVIASQPAGQCYYGGMWQTTCSQMLQAKCFAYEKYADTHSLGQTLTCSSAACCWARVCSNDRRSSVNAAVRSSTAARSAATAAASRSNRCASSCRTSHDMLLDAGRCCC